MDVDAADRAAAALTARGIDFVGAGASALAAALACFDRAIELRQAIVASGRPEFGYGLGSSWLNRGEALLRHGGPRQLEAAVTAFQQGIAALAGLNWQVDARVRRRLAVGWHNRGLALQSQPGAEEGARDSFTQALAVLDAVPTQAIEGERLLRGAVLISLANSWTLDPAGDAQGKAEAAAERAIDLVSLDEAGMNVEAAELAIKARYALCRAVVRVLPMQGALEPTHQAALHRMTDAVDEALELVRRFEHRGHPDFRPLAIDLLRLGSRVYARFQPQFLDEFHREYLEDDGLVGTLDGDPGLRLVRLEALWLSLSHARRSAFHSS